MVREALYPQRPRSGAAGADVQVGGGYLPVGGGEIHALAERFSAVSPDEKSLYDAAELLKVFGDATRLRIISGRCQN